MTHTCGAYKQNTTQTSTGAEKWTIGTKTLSNSDENQLLTMRRVLNSWVITGLALIMLGFLFVPIAMALGRMKGNKRMSNCTLSEEWGKPMNCSNTTTTSQDWGGLAGAIGFFFGAFGQVLA